jgi:predicted dehydrogenase
MATRKLRVGLIGAGWQSETHLRGYKLSGKAEIVAIADPKEAMARSVMGKLALDCRYYDDYRKLLADPAVEAVSVVAPNTFHSEITVAAAKAGEHLLAEKPFVTNQAEAKASWEALVVVELD